MGLAQKAAVAIVAVAASIGGPAGTAAAATSAPAASVSCGWIAYPAKGAYYTDGLTEFWLSLNTCNDTARAVVNSSKSNDHGIDYAWHVWVYNENSGVTADAWDQKLNYSNVYTSAIDNSLGEESHACIQPYDQIGGTAQGKKLCTAYQGLS